MAASITHESGCFLDEFLSNYDFCAAYEIGINAPASLVYERLLVSDFYTAWVVRFLMSLRTGSRIPHNRPSRDLRERFTGTGFVILAEAPCEELVIGVAGRFWRPDGGRCLDLRASDFVGFSRSGCAKAAMNFSLRSESLHRTVLRTETRIKCCDRSAWWKFRLYWTLIALFSGVMRKAILKQVKTDAEASVGRPFEGDRL
jgi:hypothetical protein